jgi:hypothetical protein
MPGVSVTSPPRRRWPALGTTATALLALASLIAACGGTPAAKYVTAGRTVCTAIHNYAVTGGGGGDVASARQRDAGGAAQDWLSRTPPPDLPPQVAADVRTWLGDGWTDALVNDPGALEAACTRLLQRVADALDVPVHPLGTRTLPAGSTALAASEPLGGDDAEVASGGPPDRAARGTCRSAGVMPV